MNYSLGLDKIWNALDGKKAYLGGGISMLTGLAGLGREILKLINDRSVPEVFEWIKNLPQDQSWLLFFAGLAAIGLRHSQAKLQDKISPQ